MARLLVVSRSMALAMRIADDHDVAEYPVERLEELAPGPDVDAVVLDLGEPSAAMRTLDRLRAGGFDTRVLVVSGYQPAWNDLVPLAIDRVVVVPLPITRAALLDGIDQLLGVTPFVPRVPPAAAASLPASAPHRPQDARRTGPLPEPAQDPGRGRPDGEVPDGKAPGGKAPDGSAPAGNGAGGRAAAPDGDRPGAGAAVGPARHEEAGGTGEQPLPVRQVGATTPTHGAGTPAPFDTAPPEPAEGRRRPGLARWLTTGPPPRGPVPNGSPHDTGNGTTRGTPTVPPSQPPSQPSPQSSSRTTSRPPSDPDAAPDLFRPVVEPSGPRRPSAPPSSAPAPGSAGPAPVRPRPAAPAERAPGPVGPPSPPVSPNHAPPREERPQRSLRGRGRRDQAQERHPGFTPASGLEAPGAPARPGEVQEWVRALLDRRSELFGVSETAQVLADEIVERGEADAAAVLVPDGAQWRVSGGVGLRPLERRLLLDTSHWLITEIAVGGRALLIEDTDIVRPRLAGAPLAAWRHLLAVPVPGIRAAVVLARGQEAARFTETDLAAVVPPVAEAGPLLQAALQMRELARVLAPLRDGDA